MSIADDDRTTGGTEVYPADRDRLRQPAADDQAPDRVIGRPGDLPTGRGPTDVREVAVQLALADRTPAGAGADQ